MFTHLHMHSEYSLLDGLSKVPDLVTRAQELGQKRSRSPTTAPSTARSSSTRRPAQGIKPIIGLEGYMAHGSRFVRTAAERSQFHLTLLAQNVDRLPATC